ncbi:hypothetical protein [Streptomyces parvulus]|uniref:hypothetical protein n=1 Tax=Streptomyces parvulus TaxID=146923 RepID=UPI0038004DAB
MIRIDSFSSDRTFTVWQYTIAHHSRVLLRSPRRTERDTRIDLHVGGVSAMFLRRSYDQLEIREGSKADRDRVISVVGPKPFQHGQILHVIEGRGATGFIVGGYFQCNETHASNNEPSGFLQMPPTE